MILQNLRASLVLFLVMTVLTGFLYPFAVTKAGEQLFQYQAGGSLISKNGTIIGSALIGQNFASESYFHGRPSAAGDGYDAANSAGSNLAVTNSDFIKSVNARVDELVKDGALRTIPVDLVTASGSGLDPDISVAAANFQAARVAGTRGLALTKVQALITQYTRNPLGNVWGEQCVNVLALNQALDQLTALTP